MLSYEVYKVLHLSFIVLFFSLLGAQLLTDFKQKWGKITLGVASFFILVSGMGLMARLQIGHGEPWPTWIFIKLAIWLILTVSVPVVAKRFLNLKKIWYWVCVVLFICASTTVNFY